MSFVFSIRKTMQKYIKRERTKKLTFFPYFPSPLFKVLPPDHSNKQKSLGSCFCLSAPTSVLSLIPGAVSELVERKRKGEQDVYCLNLQHCPQDQN